MIRLRQTIERGTSNRWLGPLFVVVLCLMLALVFLHGLHDADHATEVGEFCLGLVIVFSFLIVIRLKWRAVMSVALSRIGRSPPAPRLLVMPARLAVLPAPPPLRL